MTACCVFHTLSNALPQDALVIAHATAEIEKIVDVSITDKPKSLANGGTKTNAKIDLNRPLKINRTLTRLKDYTIFEMPTASRNLPTSS